MSKLNLLMLNYEFPPIGGGAGKAHLCLLKQFAGNSDLNIDVLTSAPKPGFSRENFSENITIYKVGVHKKNLHFWRRIEVAEWLFKANSPYRKLLRENNYDLAHAFFGFPTGWLSWRTAKKLPYIISLRGSDVPGQHARFKLDYKILGPLFIKPTWKKAVALVACSEGLKQRSLELLSNISIDVIPNGVDLEQFHPANESYAPPSSDRPLRLLTVGRLSVTKRVEMLIDAAETLRNDGCNLRLTISGGGALEPHFRQLVSDRGLGEIIELTGRIESEKMPQLYRENDIFISASMQEGMSNAMLEAMASGLPIITTRCEGVDELIAENGIVVEPADAGQIAKAVKKLADDEDSYKRMSAAARNQAEKFTWSRVAKKHLALYERLK